MSLENKQGVELGAGTAGSGQLVVGNPTIQEDQTDSKAQLEFSSQAEYFHFDSTKLQSTQHDRLPARYTKTQGGEGATSAPRRTKGRTRRRAVTQKRETHEKIDADSIDSDESGSSVDEYYEIESVASSIEEHLTWRGRMQSALHNHWFHIVIVILVGLDALIVIFELLLDVGAFGNNVCTGEGFLEQSERCHYANRDRCGPHALMILEGANISAAHGDGNGNEGLCTCKYRLGRRLCVDRNESNGVNPALVLHYCSLVILTIFMVEIVLKVIAFRLKYFTHKFEVLDGAVVVLSWTLDVASLVEEETFEAVELLILLRLWRVVRIVNGTVLAAKAQVDNQLDEARSEARRIIHAFHKCQIKLETFEKENDQLKDQLKVYRRGKAKAASLSLEDKKESYHGSDDEHMADL